MVGLVPSIIELCSKDALVLASKISWHMAVSMTLTVALQLASTLPLRLSTSSLGREFRLAAASADGHVDTNCLDGLEHHLLYHAVVRVCCEPPRYTGIVAMQYHSISSPYVFCRFLLIPVRLVVVQAS